MGDTPMTTDDLTRAIRERLTTGDDVTGLLAQLSQAVSFVRAGLVSPDAGERAAARADGEQLQRAIAELTAIGENQLDGLRTDVTAVVRKGSLAKLYGLTPT